MSLGAFEEIWGYSLPVALMLENCCDTTVRAWQDSLWQPLSNHEVIAGPVFHLLRNTFLGDSVFSIVHSGLQWSGQLCSSIFAGYRIILLNIFWLSSYCEHHVCQVCINLPTEKLHILWTFKSTEITSLSCFFFHESVSISITNVYWLCGLSFGPCFCCWLKWNKPFLPLTYTLTGFKF